VKAANAQNNISSENDRARVMVSSKVRRSLSQKPGPAKGILIDLITKSVTQPEVFSVLSKSWLIPFD
jgi:hypothetical protein